MIWYSRIKAPNGRRWRIATTDVSKLDCETQRRNLRPKVRIYSVPAIEGNVMASTTDFFFFFDKCKSD
ncbi:hypothetical protein RHMOL_Rhmol09G0052600 [Rhododendron molle]|uniref:Uncharacterized protein n=1 Tax=Rhododendron molle TaxID=49168 RepID=A0ACC0MAE4_RHOML|nr:hypothetical protein RHMOL_Rhmol09G0052600 [Rhododendron molle]